MSNRTFQQWGQGYGSTPVNITAKIDGTIVYQGPVDTLDQSWPPLPVVDTSFGGSLFSWTKPLEFVTGTTELEITVENGELLIAETYSNNSLIPTPTESNPDIPLLDEFAVAIDIADPELFKRVIFWQFDETDNRYYNDAFTDIKINGVTKNSGRWFWDVQAGQTFAATINLSFPPRPKPQSE